MTSPQEIYDIRSQRVQTNLAYMRDLQLQLEEAQQVHMLLLADLAQAEMALGLR